MILSGQSIRRLHEEAELVSPFHERTVHNGMSFGLSCAGYDVRAEFDATGDMDELVLTRGISPGSERHDNVRNGFALVSTLEQVFLPTDVMVVVHDKSTWARKGVAVQNTVFEPGWHGFPTLELTYHGDSHVVIRRGDPIAQLVFHRVDQPVENPYGGKYQGQLRGPTSAKAEKNNS